MSLDVVKLAQEFKIKSNKSGDNIFDVIAIIFLKSVEFSLLDNDV